MVVNDRVTIPDDELEWTYARSGGPGGQNVNKVASKAQLRWRMAASAAIPDPAKARLRELFPSRCTTEGDVVIASQEYRDQERNRQECLEKLAAIVRKALVVPTPRRKTRPTKGSQRRRLEDKKQQSEKKQGRRAGGDD